MKRKKTTKKTMRKTTRRTAKRRSRKRTTRRKKEAWLLAGSDKNLSLWGCSADGSAPDWQRGGGGFDPRQLHQVVVFLVSRARESSSQAPPAPEALDESSS